MNRGQFIDIAAAADFLGPGAIEVNRYQNEITDISFFRNIGLAFIVLTAIAGSMTVGLIVQQTNAAAVATIASAE